ncbi:MAG: phosphoribosylglycinamide formyltransferase [Pyrinomonadaceae bacterium]
MKKIGILISGRGSNMLALADAVRSHRIPNAEIAIVISNRADAEGIERARERGFRAHVIEQGNLTREDHDRKIMQVLNEYDVDLICLAGYMRLLSTQFIDAYRGRILNIHPSLLPSFPGLHPQRQALEHGVKWSGCTVHIVDASLDGGPILIQRVVPVNEDDTEEWIEARILAEEHVAYSEAVELVLSGEYRIEGRRVIRLRESRKL